jgi:photosynthetic reaction center cytochrome c subunit
MARDVNNEYIVPLTATFPANRLGPTGDVAKVYCATCHQGANKPVGGLQHGQAVRRPAAPAAAEEPAEPAKGAPKAGGKPAAQKSPPCKRSGPMTRAWRCC